MSNSPFQTTLFVRHSAAGATLRNAVSAYNDCQLNDEIIDLIVTDLFNAIRDDWDTGIAESIRYVLSIAATIAEYAKKNRAARSNPDVNTA